MSAPQVTIAVCSYNRAERLPALVGALRVLACPLPFEVLVIDNNSSDTTPQVLNDLSAQSGVPLRHVREARQGIVHARNRAIAETAQRDYLLFIDDDELPLPGYATAALDALGREGADCVGGRIEVPFRDIERPRWLTDEVAGFLGALDYGAEPFWICDTRTPIWSGNVGYRRAALERYQLRFDPRYNRAGDGVGGGEDAMMFRALIARKAAIRYRPDMAIEHLIDASKLRRAYFLRLHYTAGVKLGRYGAAEPARSVFGVPPFMLNMALRQGARALRLWLAGDPNSLRAAMTAAHTLGQIRGRRQRQPGGNGAGALHTGD